MKELVLDDILNLNLTIVPELFYFLSPHIVRVQISQSTNRVNRHI